MSFAKRPGITMVEAVVTIAVVAICAIPASKMWVASAEADEAIERKVKALVLAQLILESKVRVVPFGEQQASAGHEDSGDLDWTLTLTDVNARLRRAEVLVTGAGDGRPLMRLAVMTAKED